MKIAAQGRDRAGAFHFFVDEGVSAPARTGAVNEAQTKIRIPIAVRDPAVDEPDLTGEARAGEGVEIGAGKKCGDRGAEGRGNFFVGVETKRPRLGRECEGGVFGVAKTLPGQVMNTGPGAKCEGLGGVGGGVEHHNHLGCPAAHAGKAAREIRGLIFGHDDDGKLKWVSHSISET